ncbi:MAG TPA: CPBP family intramembrane metalloprotease [candidate division Zixibacteria bacterium]|nr:CPBP family intramembrane metalloprotease [candidate division Zixibacteria bacterium]
MSNSLRLIIGIVLGAFIFLLALYVVPSIRFISAITKHPSIGNGEITQLTLLVVSLILAYYLSGKNLSSYGFKLIGFEFMLKPILISVLSVILFFVMMNIMMAITGLKPDELGGSGLDKSILNFLITVALFASICEEIFYRGLIYSFLEPFKKHRFRFFKSYISLPVTVCALMFGLGHLCLLGSMSYVIVISIVVSATLLGFIAGYYREKTGSLLPAIAAHITFNIVAFGIPTIMTSIK